LESADRDHLADLERHQVLTDRQRPAIGLSGLGDNIVDRRRRNALAAEQNDMRIGGELRLRLGKDIALNRCAIDSRRVRLTGEGGNQGIGRR
jgi:hypothetical protein